MEKTVLGPLLQLFKEHEARNRKERIIKEEVKE